MPLVSALLLTHLLQASPIETRFAEIEAGSGGRLGAAIVTPKARHYSRRSERFSLQSVMKMVVAMAALDQVDQGKLKRGQKFTFQRSDLSLGYQPLADILGKKSTMTVTLEQCIELTVTQSCSASGDFLIRKMGSIGVLNAFLKKHKINGMTVDRQERDLQTNVVGLTWKPEFVDPAKLEKAISLQTEAQRTAAYKKYQADPRDTTTPEAMVALLERLVTGKLLSKRSTKYLMGVMERTETGEDRLKAGVQKGWILGHKTGTSSTSGGVAAATNDVGYVRNAKGDWIIIVALVGDSTQSPERRAESIRKVAETAFLTK